jgi:endo-1,4-beta-xylanase
MEIGMRSGLRRRQLLIGTAATLSTPAWAAGEPPGMVNALNGARLKPSGLAATAAQSHRLFGTSLNVQHLSDTDYLNLVARQSSILVPENALKADVTRASSTGFNFADADQVYAFASENKMAFRGHTLCWYRSVPPWVRDSLVTPAQARQELYLEVREPCLHFKGRVHSWDVVNEVLSWQDEQPFGLRSCYWLQMVGPDYVDMAFLTARQADPNALLCFNASDIEYDHPWFEKNRQTLLTFVRRLRGNNVPIDVIAIESHLRGAGVAKFPFSPTVFKRFLSEISDLGLHVIISELDVPDRNLPPDIATRDRDVANCYGELVTAAVGHPAVIAILCWGLTDRYAWMNADPNLARPDGLPSRSMLFDDNLEPKLAYDAVVTAFSQAVPVSA